MPTKNPTVTVAISTRTSDQLREGMVMQREYKLATDSLPVWKQQKLTKAEYLAFCIELGYERMRELNLERVRRIIAGEIAARAEGSK